MTISTRRAIAVVAATFTSALGVYDPEGSAKAEVGPVTLTAIGGAVKPVDVAFRPGDDALYVVEKRGVVQRLTADGSVAEFDVQHLVSTEPEQGLLGLAFSPDGSHAYINYTDVNGDTIVAEFEVGGDGGIVLNSMRSVIEVDQPYANHNGGHLAFGPDGMLYVGMGDGGGSGDPERRAQDLTTLLGKLLRIDPTPSGQLGYTIPPNNPFVNDAGRRPEIWSYGLRNPWRFSFDAATGDLWIADVGQNDFEEIDLAPAVNGRDAGRGSNFGWSAYEGNQQFNEDVVADGALRPVYVYPHTETRCSVIGGVRARGATAGPLDGRFIFADACSGEIFAMPVAGDGANATVGEPTIIATTKLPTAVVAAPNGTLIVLSYDAVNRIDP